MRPGPMLIQHDKSSFFPNFQKKRLESSSTQKCLRHANLTCLRHVKYTCFLGKNRCLSVNDRNSKRNYPIYFVYAVKRFPKFFALRLYIFPIATPFGFYLNALVVSQFIVRVRVASLPELRNFIFKTKPLNPSPKSPCLEDIPLIFFMSAALI